MRDYRIFVKLCLSFLWLGLFCNRNTEIPSSWPENGACFRDITWEIPLCDSSRVLRLSGGVWVLPDPPSGDRVRIGRSCHQSVVSGEKSAHFKTAHQIVMHQTGPLIREYYRFDGAVMLLGYETREPENQMTVYEPPLTLFPAFAADSVFQEISESVPKQFRVDGEQVGSGQKTRLKLTQKMTGVLKLDSLSVKARLCELMLSSDRSVGFGGSDLIVPDAVMMQNQILIADGYGPVLEWGIRSRPGPETSAAPVLSGDPRAIESREYFIEVTRHERIDR